MPKKLDKLDHKHNEKLAKIRKNNVERHAGYENTLKLRANIQRFQRNATYDPVQNLFWLKVNDAATFAKGFKKYNSKHNPDDRRVTLGQFNLGRSPIGETHYVLVGVNDFKTAMNPGLYRQSNPAAKEAWGKYMDDIDGNVELIRTSTRVMLGKW